MPHPKIGEPAPAFELNNQNGELCKLSDFRGKRVILYFYPKAMTPGCTVQACGLRDTASELQENNVVSIGVSPDPFARLKKFEEKESLNFTLLSDEDHQIAESYGAWGLKKFMGKEYMGILRSTFIIDEEGKLAAIFDKVKTKTHHDDMLDWIKTNL